MSLFLLHFLHYSFFNSKTVFETNKKNSVSSLVPYLIFQNIKAKIFFRCIICKKEKIGLKWKMTNDIKIK